MSSQEVSCALNVAQNDNGQSTDSVALDRTVRLSLEKYDENRPFHRNDDDNSMFCEMSQLYKLYFSDSG